MGVLAVFLDHFLLSFSLGLLVLLHRFSLFPVSLLCSPRVGRAIGAAFGMRRHQTIQAHNQENREEEKSFHKALQITYNNFT